LFPYYRHIRGLGWRFLGFAAFMSSVGGSTRPEPADQLLGRAVSLFQQGRFAQSEALCRSILERDRRQPDALHLMALSALQQGSSARAIVFFRESLASAPHRPVVHTNLAIALLQAGDARAALVSCDAALVARPDYAEAHNARGNVMLALHNPAEALASYTRASRLKPGMAALHSNRGNALRDLGRPQEALESYEQALRIDPALREALIGCAGMLRALGRGAEALLALAKTLERNPNDAGALLERGNLLFQMERITEALACYDSLLARRPDDADACFNRANALLRLQRDEEALQSFDRYIALKQDLARAHHFRGNTLRRLRRPLEALESFARAVAIDPHYVDALNGMGDVYRDGDRFSEAIEMYSRALAINSHSLLSLSNLSRAFLAAKHPEEAVQHIERLLAISPDTGREFRHALGNLHQSRMLTCDWRDYDTTVAAIDADIVCGKHVTTPALYMASGNSPEIHLKCARLYAERKWGHANTPTWTQPPYKHNRIRVAYVSADFREHAVSYLMAGIFERHDRTRFEITGVSLAPPDKSSLGERVRRAFSTCIDVAESSDEEIVRLLQEREIDIAVDLTGYTAGSRAGIFARRAAPIQVNYLGYSASTGAPFMDYMITDAVVVPEEYRAFYSETVEYLPCYLPPGDRRSLAPGVPTRAECGLPERGFVFSAHHLYYKITPHVFGVWMRLLNAIEGSVLWLPVGPEAAMRNLATEATKRGVDPARLVFAPRVPDAEDHLARYACADLFLDTAPYNAHTTTSDALWAGLPVLTCEGHTFAGRVASSLLGSLGLHELVTDNLESYEARARELAESPALLGDLRARLKSQRDSHPLFDADAFTRQLERAYITMWERFERGQPATGF
jgi:protein O-GlcNAc transferase